MHFFATDQQFHDKIDASITFGGLTRDSEDYLSESLTCLRTLGSHFSSYRIVLYENDSEDNTVGVLEREGVEFISEKFSAPSYGMGGLAKMAYFRKRLQEKIVEKPADFVAIFDLDILGLNYDGFFSCFAHQGWGAMFALGKCVRYPHTDLLFYDYFAHRENGEETYDPNYNFKYQKLEGGLPFEVDSSFGGIAVYTGLAYGWGSYNLENGKVCEHVPFHASLRAAGFKLYLNPEMVVLHK